MRTMPKRISDGTFIVTALVFIAVLTRHSATVDKRRDQAQEDSVVQAIFDKSAQTAPVLDRMSHTFNAATNWEGAFGGARFSERLGVDELAPVLKRKDNRPLLVIGSLVDIRAKDNDCELLIDAKANLVSNIRFMLACTPEQVKEALTAMANAERKALEGLREDDGDGVEQASKEIAADSAEAKLEARRGYAVVAKVDSVHPGEAETIDRPSIKAPFIFAEGHCLRLTFVGQGYSEHGNEEAHLRLSTSEIESRAREQMDLYLETQQPKR